MSIPRNHHFVSQVLIKRFLGIDNTLNIYSKSQNKIIVKPFERQDFAERDLNSIVNECGVIDHKSVEDNLNKYFETEFNRNYNLLMLSIENDDPINFHNSIEYLIRIGIIGDMRTRDYQNETHKTILGGIGALYDLFSDELKIGYNKLLQRTSKVKNKTSVNYNQICNGVLELMGEFNCSVFKVSKNNYFFLPDNTSITIREKLIPDFITKERQVLESPGQSISTIFYPINSEMLIVVQSTKVSPKINSGIFQLSLDDTIEYNKLFFEKARDKVICSNNEYLTGFINRYIL